MNEGSPTNGPHPDATPAPPAAPAPDANGHAPGVPGAPHGPGCFAKLGWLFVGLLVGLEAILRWLTAYPLFLLQLVVLLLVAWGGLGEDLGAEHLFWHERLEIQLNTGITVGLLVSVLLFLNYVLYRPEWLVGKYLPDATFQPGLLQHFPGTLLPSRNAEVRRFGRFLLWGMVAVLLLIVGPKLYAANQANEAEKERIKAVQTGTPPSAAAPADGAHGYMRDRLWLAPFLGGYLLSAVFAFVLFVFDERFPLRLRPTWREWLVTRHLIPPIGRPGWRTIREYLEVRTPEAVPPEAVALHGVAMLLMGLAITVFVTMLGMVWALDRWWPGISLTGLISLVCLIFILVSLIYGFLEYHLHIQRLALVCVVGGLLVWNSTDFFHGGNSYKLQFPGLDEDSGLGEGDFNLPLWDPNRKDNGIDVEAVLGATEPYAEAYLIPAEEPLRQMCERWQARPGHEHEKPRIVIICTSGGGIRAAVWTGVVLNNLEQDTTRLPGFRDHIRLITGASGGMVGATLYAADFENGPRDYTAALGADSLTRTGQSLILRDMIKNTAFVAPWQHAEWDRGRTLEWMWELNAAKHLEPKDDEQRQAWKNPFTKGFAELRTLERQGKRPSLIYSPLMVEDSRRLLISNLNLSNLPDPDPLADLSIAAGPHGQAGRSAVEFHRLFPDLPLGELRELFPPLDTPSQDPSREQIRQTARKIRSSENFRVVTAARMNATFPIISPAVSLPTFPPRRLVDAGIYDNYGVNLAALWLLKNQSALCKYTSGVALVQVRAFPLHDARNRFASFDPDTGKLAARPPRGDLLADSLAAASAPTEALFSARSNAAFFRNAEQLEVLHRAFNKGLAAPPNNPQDLFFCTAWLELRRPAALNWYLTRGEYTAIQAAYGDAEVTEQHEKLRKWYGTGGKVSP